MKDLMVMTVLFLVMTFISFGLDIAEHIEMVIEEYESFELDEIILVAAFFSVFLTVFALRRWKETKTELKRRISVDQELEKSNLDLRCKALELENHSSGISNLTKLANFLQVCKSEDEAYKVMKDAADNLFPRSEGALYMMRDSRNLLEKAFQWGGQKLTMPDFFPPDDCWGLRIGKTHRSGSHYKDPLCSHALESHWENHVCIPLTAYGEIIGLLYLLYSKDTGENPDLPECRPNEFALEYMAEAFSEQISLTLSNIELQRRLENLAVHDTLTGLYNRIYLEETFEKEIHRAQRREGKAGVMMMDLDHFKRLNDTYGHAAGDMALQEVGKILRSFFRPEDFCCRYGGEEFLILLPEAITKDVYQRAEALRKQIHTLKLAFQDRPIGTISISIGIAVFPDHGQDMTRILKAADQALYRAKKEGRNRVCIAENTPGQAG